MELNTAEISPLHAGTEGKSVVAARDCRRARRQGVAVHEIRVVVLVQALEQRARPIYLERVPSHMGHRKAQVARQTGRTPGNQAETLRFTFLGRLEQQLHSEANAEHRLLQQRNQ